MPSRLNYNYDKPVDSPLSILYKAFVSNRRRETHEKQLPVVKTPLVTQVSSQQSKFFGVKRKQGYKASKQAKLHICAHFLLRFFDATV